ncbi:hypothetical protein ETB97_005772 [Aspergillus alliaceus]|uniref:Uncharacterized protein n=1 Tax=Petromyces alliaceus TaxID=209559 RepID=A0A8H5ZYK0_PETAA|nr:hypothetical protein ETB97_005772 [Aspergillus burnettii]
MGDLGTPQPVSFRRALTDLTSEADPSSSRRFVVALDFGTTFSSVSVICVNGQREESVELHLSQVWSVSGFPDAPSSFSANRVDVPTQCLYPRGTPHRDPITHLMMTYDGTESTNNYEGSRGRDVEGITDNLGGYTMSDDNELDFMDIDTQLGDYYWGYEVHKIVRELDDEDERRAQGIHRFKLLLDTSELTSNVRKELIPTLDMLLEKNIISDKRETDIIADYLKRLFDHTKVKMREKHLYTEGETVEFVLCIPAIWTRKACRKMQMAMTAALHRTGFITEQFHDVDNLFIVHEPEAAAAYVLAQTKDITITAGESFVLLDAGGGTVDAVTYKVTSDIPLRLAREAVAPGGDLCGSSYLNEAFENLVKSRLQGEDYLQNVQMKIDTMMEEFENNIKRNFDPSRQHWWHYFRVDGLLENKKKRFTKHRMYIDRYDMEQVFKDCLERTSRLMLGQIEEAQSRGITATKVLLIGGFAASPALVQHLKADLDQYSRNVNRAIQLLLPPSVSCTAVASGAILRALRKEDGPARAIFSSYGVMRAEPYDRDNKAHVEQVKKRTYDAHDKNPYIKKTITWFANRGDVLEPRSEFVFPVSHTFPTSRKELVCQEILYVSDRNHRSSYRVDHEENEGVEEAGRIVVDMTYLKDEGHIVPIRPPGGNRHYLIEFDLVVIVDGRNLQFEARYPRGSTGDAPNG